MSPIPLGRAFQNLAFIGLSLADLSHVDRLIKVRPLMMQPGARLPQGDEHLQPRVHRFAGSTPGT